MKNHDSIPDQPFAFAIHFIRHYRLGLMLMLLFETIQAACPALIASTIGGLIDTMKTLEPSTLGGHLPDSLSQPFLKFVLLSVALVLASRASGTILVLIGPVLRSLIDNIRYGRPEASDDEVIAAAREASCDEFISSRPEGYATVVGERGIKLSGGQRQRIAIARAMLKDAPILVLDEATSALDSESERLIQQSLGNMMQGRTTLVIAHRLSTIAAMDRILVFDQGRIVEDGDHAALIA